MWYVRCYKYLFLSWLTQWKSLNFPLFNYRRIYCHVMFISLLTWLFPIGCKKIESSSKVDEKSVENAKRWKVFIIVEYKGGEVCGLWYIFFLFYRCFEIEYIREDSEAKVHCRCHNTSWFRNYSQRGPGSWLECSIVISHCVKRLCLLIVGLLNFAKSTILRNFLR